jgi:hypothetical protein
MPLNLKYFFLDLTNIAAVQVNVSMKINVATVVLTVMTHLTKKKVYVSKLTVQSLLFDVAMELVFRKMLVAMASLIALMVPTRICCCVELQWISRSSTSTQQGTFYLDHASFLLAATFATLTMFSKKNIYLGHLLLMGNSLKSCVLEDLR